MSPFRAVLFDAGDTLIRLSGGGEQLLHRAAMALGQDSLDPEDAARVWQRVLAQAGTQPSWPRAGTCLRRGIGRCGPRYMAMQDVIAWHPG